MTPTADPNLRNVAIIAHVDHGKTTLVDALLAQSGALARRGDAPVCVLDSDPLERERGITILSKNCAIEYASESSETPIRINLIDTPGHADFGGEVERVLRMADGCLLLVDAFEGPRPQTRFVVGKALSLGLKPIVVVNKCDRPEARPDEVVNEVFDLLVALEADDEALDFPVIYASGRDGWAGEHLDHRDEGVKPLLDTIVTRVPAPSNDPAAPMRMLVTTLGYSEYVGRIAIGRVHAGVVRSGMPVAVCRADGSLSPQRVLKVHRFRGLEREPVEAVKAGDLCALEGLAAIDVGDTVADPERARPLPRVAVDEPTLHMLFRVNDSPFAGREGRYVTSRQIADRLARELETNVALRVEPGSSGEEFVVSGRGLLHLGILIENMRREGFELGVGRPEVVRREVDGETCEPIEQLVLDLAPEALGAALEQVGSRGGEVKTMEERAGRMRVTAEIPARGLIGLRSRLLTATGGEVVMDHSFLKWAPVRLADPGRSTGVLLATDSGTATTYALFNLADRGVMFIRPQDPVYAGQVVGEHNRDNDLPVNVVKAKAFSNVRESTKEATTVLKAPRLLSLEAALEYIQGDELVEVTPTAIRLRKRTLDAAARRRADRARKAAVNA